MNLYMLPGVCVVVKHSHLNSVETMIRCNAPGSCRFCLKLNTNTIYTYIYIYIYIIYIYIYIYIDMQYQY